jgi:urate oxidase
VWLEGCETSSVRAPFLFYSRLFAQQFVVSVLKSTGSAFENFVRDEYTTLPEVDDRIFSTSVDLRYTFGQVNVQLPSDEKRLVFGVGNLSGGVHPWEDAKVGARSREITLDVFALDESASVQVRGNAIDG